MFVLSDDIKKLIEFEMISIFNSFIPKFKPSKPSVIFICGITASGKSSLVNSLTSKFFEPNSFIIINPDDFLIKLSIFSSELLPILYPYVSFVTLKIIEPLAIKSGFNLVFDRVCRYASQTIKKINLFKKLHYSVILALNYVSINTAKKRLLKRNLENPRKIPISIIDDMYNTISTEFKKFMNIKIDHLLLYNSENFPPSLILSKNKLSTIFYQNSPFYFKLDKYI